MKLTPHQRIVRAARRGGGVRLSPDDCFALGVMDDAIITAALNDDETQEAARETRKIIRNAARKPARG